MQSDRYSLFPLLTQGVRGNRAENLHGADAEILDAQAVRRVVGIEASRDYIAVDKVGLACAGNSSRIAAMGGLRLPIERLVIMNGRKTILFTP